LISAIILVVQAAMLEAQKALVVEPPPTPNATPVFVEALHDAIITQGNRFTFQCRYVKTKKLFFFVNKWNNICRATGHPAPQYEWFKNGALILNNPDYKSSLEDGNCKLYISETFSDDSAKFTCKAYNVAGEALTHATLTVKGTD